ncbi:MAG: hypothetical protein ACP5T3_02315, partial [Candidatus Micrarchaeia archaeon]
MQILVDTSAILFALRNTKNAFDALLERFPGAELVVSRGVVSELKKFAKGTSGISAYARFALKDIASRNVTVVGDSRMPDLWLLDSSAGSIVCTNDMALKRKLKEKGAEVLSISKSG